MAERQGHTPGASRIVRIAHANSADAKDPAYMPHDPAHLVNEVNETATASGWLMATGLPAGVTGGTATRRFAGVSDPPYDRANYGLRCGDTPATVMRNRALLRAVLQLSAEPVWLQQVHGVDVVVVDEAIATDATQTPIADACVIRCRGTPAVIQTADCLPILLASTASEDIAAIHAGWRSLAGGVIEATLAQLPGSTAAVHAWLGPAIGQDAFEVGPEVRAAFADADAGAAECFRPGRDDRWHADLYALARRRLRALGVAQISGGDWCTVAAPERFHSYRRDGAASGRMATLIWRQ